MLKPARPSQFNPVYLVSRHVGMFFYLMALGLAGGLLWRGLFQPTRYGAVAEAAAVPVGAAHLVDWEAKESGWQGVIANNSTRRLLSSNLRLAVKLAATKNLTRNNEWLRDELSGFNPRRSYPASLFRDGLPARFGPVLEITLRDVAANLDFQSLAEVIADLDPPRGVASWDFSFFRPGFDGDLRSVMITNPGPEDRHFRVFYHLHSLIHPDRHAASPEEVWRTAVDELSARLEREREFSGGGGFGVRTRRELVRELAAIPGLAANSLYGASGWFNGDGDFREQAAVWDSRWAEQAELVLAREDGAGVLRAAMTMDLHPIAFPRDTVLTRIPPLAVGTLLAFIAAKETPAPVPEAEVKAASAIADPEPESVPEAVAVPVKTAATPAGPDEAERHARLMGEYRERISRLERELGRFRLDRDAALRRGEAAREGERRLTLEALAARSRADRLRERLDEAEAAGGKKTDAVPGEVARLLADRDAVLERLAELLPYCTEEHPFVKRARRELQAIELLLAAEQPAAKAENDAEIRLAGLRLEWEAANSSAANLEERRRRQTAEAENALAAVNVLEKKLTGQELELAAAEGEKPVPPPEPAPILPPEPTPASVSAPAPEPMPEPDLSPFIEVAAPPARIPLTRERPGWEAPTHGLLAGLLLGVVWMAARELLTFRIAGAAEARHLVDYPLLASLPAYDGKSFLAAAKTMKGEVDGARAGSMAFIPAPVELSEPAAAAKRARVKAAGKRPRIMPWIIGAALLAVAAAAQYKADVGFFQPLVDFRGELALPEVDTDNDGAAEEWGDLP